jgi:hypothetical protein
MSNTLSQQRRRNGAETWRRRSCQCKHLHLITHEKILLNGDVPRRNGNVTYSVNRPLFGFEPIKRSGTRGPILRSIEFSHTVYFYVLCYSYYKHRFFPTKHLLTGHSDGSRLCSPLRTKWNCMYMKYVNDLAFKGLNVQTDLPINFSNLHYAVLSDYTIFNKTGSVL